MLLLLLACSAPPRDAAEIAPVAQLGRYSSGVGHMAVRRSMLGAEGEGEVTVQTRGGDGVWSTASSVSVNWDGPDALDVVLVADNSGSVAAWDDEIAEAVFSFGMDLLGDPDNRVGLVRVSTEASTLTPLSADDAAWASGVAALEARNGWTALWDGVRLGHEVHAEADQLLRDGDVATCVGVAHRGVVVYTDGQDNNSADEHPTSYDGDGVDTTLGDLFDLDVVGIQPPVFTIGVGDGVDEGSLLALATATGGGYYPIADHGGLSGALSATADALGAEVPVCWEAPDCADTEALVTVTSDSGTWSATFDLPEDLCSAGSEGGCTLTQGYWQNHEEDWPVDELTLGGRVYSRDALLDLLDRATRGDRSLQLAHQLIAARLNEERGADTSALGTTMDDVDTWLAAHDDGDGLPFGTRSWDGAEAWHDSLDAFNNGEIGPGHCD